MTKAPAGVANLPGPYFPYWAGGAAAMIIVAGSCLTWAGHASWDVIETWVTG